MMGRVPMESSHQAIVHCTSMTAAARTQPLAPAAARARLAAAAWPYSIASISAKETSDTNGRDTAIDSVNTAVLQQ